MNLVGKIFVVLIFFMSITFMSFAVMVYGTHTNWKQEVLKEPGGYKAQLKQARDENAKLVEDRDRLVAQLTSEKLAALQARAKQETENQQLIAERNRLAGQIDELTVSQQNATAAFKVAQETMSKLTDEVEGLRTEIRRAQTDAQQSFVAATERADKLHVAMNQLEILRARELELVQEVTRLRAIAKNAPGSPSDALPASGTVLAVGGDDLIELSIGSDDGIQVGHMLDVSRGGKYLGRVRVLKTGPDRAVATVIPSYRQGIIQKGDNVATVRQPA